MPTDAKIVFAECTCLDGCYGHLGTRGKKNATTPHIYLNFLEGISRLRTCILVNFNGDPQSFLAN